MKWVLAFFLWMISSPALANWIVFVVDASGSISKEEYALQKVAYVEILRDPATRELLDGFHIAIVEFAVHAEVIVQFTRDFDFASQIYLQHRRGNMNFATDVNKGLQKGIELLINKKGMKIIDISGDGVNAPFGGRRVLSDLQVEATRDLASEQNIQINALPIGEPMIMSWYQKFVVNGFAMPAEDFNSFRAALRRKLFLEIVLAKQNNSKG